MARSKVQVWVVSQQSILLLKLIASRGGGWQPITGWVESGESGIQAAQRELREETGIDGVPDGPLRSLEFEVNRPFYQGQVTEAVFVLYLKVKPPIQVDPKEHDAYEWVSAKKAIQRLRYASQRDSLSFLKGI